MEKSFEQIIIPSQITSAIPIVNPSQETKTTKVILKPLLKPSNRPQCRNIIIHGFCKFEDKGCEFNHETKPISQQTSLESKKKTQNLSTLHVSANAPEFFPRLTVASTFDKDQSEFSQFSSLETSPSPTSPTQVITGIQPQYYYMHQRQHLQHHLYTQPLPHISNLLPHQLTIQHLFIPDDIRQELTQRNEAQLMTASVHELGLPSKVHVYHSLYPLDTNAENLPSSIYGYPTAIYKATCSVDGCTYALVRIKGFKLVNEQVMRVIEAWTRIRHCNIVSIREAFTTRSFGDSSLMFAYDYHPCSSTLYSTYFTSPDLVLSQLIPETTIWSFITQIASALKVIHGSGLAARNINLKKILMTGKNRIRLNEMSILDVLQYNSASIIAIQQQEDLSMFGKLIIELAGIDNQQSNEHISDDLNKLLLYLQSKPSPTKSIDQVIVMISPYILNEVNNSQFYNDELEYQLSRELENSRLVRLMSKLGFINERPEFDDDPSWSETGDYYLIKLFRDYVFHQVDEQGNPVVDMVHVLTCLNKLDVGVEENVMLMSRDEQSCLIVSYKELKNCIINAFNDLTSNRK